jgi:hypothetical protein
MQTTYRSGRWYVLVAPGALVAVSPDAPENLVMALWERQQCGGDLAAVIDALTSQASGSFATMLPFAAVVLDGPNARVAVRGDATVEVTGPDGIDSFNGANVTTWSERFVPNASRISLAMGEADAVAMPITGGVVRASAVRADIEPADTTAPVPVEEPPVEEPSVEEQPVVEAPVEEVPVEDAPLPEAEDDFDGATLVPTEQTFASDSDEFEQLFGATVASPNAIVTPPVPPMPLTPVDGDHDGATISLAEARSLRQEVPSSASDAATEVLPVVSHGAGKIRVSTGQVVALDRTVIIGRRPRSPRASGADLPHLIAVESPQQDISRSHLEIRPEGDTVIVIDLNTTNGSTLLRPGADPMRLHPGEQTLVLSGDVLDLGDGVTVTFEDLP